MVSNGYIQNGSSPQKLLLKDEGMEQTDKIKNSDDISDFNISIKCRYINQSHTIFDI